MTDRNRPGWAVWTSVVVVGVPVLYVLGFIPAAWLVAGHRVPLHPTAVFYKPVVNFIANRPGRFRRVATVGNGAVLRGWFWMDNDLNPRPESDWTVDVGHYPPRKRRR